MRSGSLRDRDTVEAAAQILDGLAHAHARGIVHRDVKPANVLLADGPELNVRICDFGLAQFEDADTLTAVGDVPGTLAYIARAAAREEATPASDVWGVGVLLWEGLAGAHPFWGSPLHELPASIGAGAPPLTELRPDLPKRLLSAVEGRSTSRRRNGLPLFRWPRSSVRRFGAGPSRARSPSAADSPRKPSAAEIGRRCPRSQRSPRRPDALLLRPPALAVAPALAARGRSPPRPGLRGRPVRSLFLLGNVGPGLRFLRRRRARLARAVLARRPRRVAFAVALLAPLSLLALAPLAAQAAHGATGGGPRRRPFGRRPGAGLRGWAALLGVPAPADLGLAGSEAPARRPAR